MHLIQRIGNERDGEIEFLLTSKIHKKPFTVKPWAQTSMCFDSTTASVFTIMCSILNIRLSWKANTKSAQTTPCSIPFLFQSLINLSRHLHLRKSLHFTNHLPWHLALNSDFIPLTTKREIPGAGANNKLCMLSHRTRCESAQICWYSRSLFQIEECV